MIVLRLAFYALVLSTGVAAFAFLFLMATDKQETDEDAEPDA